MSNPADNIYNIVRETVEGTTPATPVFLALDYVPGNEFKLDSKLLSSDVLKQNRGMAGSTVTSISASGTLKTHFRRDTALDLLLETGLSGTFTSNVLKGGSTDHTHTVEKRMTTSSGAYNYYRYTGLHVKKFGLSVDAGANCEATFDMVGMGKTTGTAIITGATYTQPVQGPLYTGNDVGTLTIGSFTATYMSLELSVEHTRDPRFKLGSPNSFGTGTGGLRTIKLTVKAYRDDLTPETSFGAGASNAVTFTLGSGSNNMYTFSIPAMTAIIPVDEVSGANAMVTIELTANTDPTALTDISITKS